MSKKNNEDQLPSLDGVDKESLAKSLAISMQIRRLQSAAQKYFELSNANHPSHSGLPIADPREHAKDSLVSAAILFIHSNVNTKLGLEQTRDMLVHEARGGNKNSDPWELKLSIKQSNIISGIMSEIQKDPVISEKLSNDVKVEKKI